MMTTTTNPLYMGVEVSREQVMLISRIAQAVAKGEPPRIDRMLPIEFKAWMAEGAY